MIKLLIVESPAKAKTLKKYLDKDFKVIASYGHIRNLPSVVNAVEPENNFKITYKNTVKSKAIIDNLADNFKKTKIVYLATDPDREGEAISWHILEVMKGLKSLGSTTKIKRITFNEVNKNAVIHAINNPRDLNQDLIYAQQARQVLDYLVGFTLSPILWKKLPGSKSAGRVQSVALKILCIRENERDKFQKQEHWTIQGIFLKDTQTNYRACLYMCNNQVLKKFTIDNKNKAECIIKGIKTYKYKVSVIKRKKVIKKAVVPFITATLIQESFKKFNLKLLEIT